MNKTEAAKMIDHTILKPDASRNDILKLCSEAVSNNFMSVCINPCFISYAKELLQNSDVKICTVVGFPLGASPTETKVHETGWSIESGAEEVDMVINIGAVKSGDYKYVEDDVKAVVNKAKSYNKDIVVKVIIETCLLTQGEKEQVISLLLSTGADFVKTSTGFSSGGATADDIALMKKIVGNKMFIKASGGVRNIDDFMLMASKGADRIGTSSGIAILEGLKNF